MGGGVWIVDRNFFPFFPHGSLPGISSSVEKKLADLCSGKEWPLEVGMRKNGQLPFVL